MKLEEVIHLYQNCDVMLMNNMGIDHFEHGEDESGSIWRLGAYCKEGIHMPDSEECPVYLKSEHGWVGCYLSDIKPVLRKLSDMTEEEMKELALLNYSIANTFKSAKISYQYIDIKASGFTKHLRVDLLGPTPISLVYLLSKGFDLFNLIDSNQAIDKSTL